MKMMYFLAINCRITSRQCALQVYTFAYVSIAKLGKMTQKFAHKMLTSMKDELDVAVTLNKQYFANIFNHFLKGVIATNDGVIISVIDHIYS